MNAGAYVICVQIMSPVALTVSLDGWVVDVQHDCAAATANFAGPWSGTYTCTDTCTNAPFGGSVQLTVTQDSTGKASYTDEDGITLLCGGVCTDTLARR